MDEVFVDKAVVTLAKPCKITPACCEAVDKV